MQRMGQEIARRGWTMIFLEAAKLSVKVHRVWLWLNAQQQLYTGFLEVRCSDFPNGPNMDYSSISYTLHLNSGLKVENSPHSFRQASFTVFLPELSFHGSSRRPYLTPQTTFLSIGHGQFILAVTRRTERVLPFITQQISVKRTGCGHFAES